MFRPGNKLARSIHRHFGADVSVDVSEVDGVRNLHLGNDTVQSAMRLKTPHALELAYTRGMMAYLLFSEKVERVLAIGLGGGSVPKYLHHHLPAVNTTVVVASGLTDLAPSSNALTFSSVWGIGNATM